MKRKTMIKMGAVLIALAVIASLFGCSFLEPDADEATRYTTEQCEEYGAKAEREVKVIPAKPSTWSEGYVPAECWEKTIDGWSRVNGITW